MLQTSRNSLGNIQNSTLYEYFGFILENELATFNKGFQDKKYILEEELIEELIEKFPLNASQNRKVYLGIGIGSPKIKEKIYKKYKKEHRVNFVNIVSNLAQAEESINGWVFKPEQGLYIANNVNLTTNVSLGKHVHLNTACTVCHDAKIDDFSIVSPGAIVCGNVSIGKRCYIGAGAVIRDGVSIADDTTIGAGTVVVKDIEETGRTFIGVPAKELK